MWLRAIRQRLAYWLPGRLVVTLLPLLLALLHAGGWWHIGALEQLDHLVYDVRLRATMPRTLDPRIVVVDIDEASLAEVGHWPWGRDTVARLVDELWDRQQARLIGFDMLFAEPDTSSGLQALQQLAAGPLRHQPGFAQQLQALAPQLDYDARLAQAVQGRKVVLGYYFNNDNDNDSNNGSGSSGHIRGVLPAPVMGAQPGLGHVTAWDGYGANIAVLAKAAPQAGFFNAVADSDGVVRSIPLLAQYQGQYYEALALALYRRLLDLPRLVPGLAPSASGPRLSRLQLLPAAPEVGRPPIPAIPAIPSIALDRRAIALVPFRGPGGPEGGSFRYLSAADVLAGRLPAASLAGKIVLVGTSAPGLLDERAVPVSSVFPGVEVHANMLSGLLSGRQLVQPDYARGYELVLLLLIGLLLALLPRLSVWAAVRLSAALLAALLGLNLWLYLGWGLVLPLASLLCTVWLATALNMGYGYLVEGNAKRRLAELFGTYVPPELVAEMLRQPDRYSMQAQSRELTVMFCDMRGFTRMAEQLTPLQLQALLNLIFSRLTQVIRSHHGTIDKYMGDCVMAFWGAPVANAAHAERAVQAALAMAEAIQSMPETVRMGIGLSTGPMCVGDMGSDIRRSYTVIGDAVNLGSRLEGLCTLYGVAIVASDATRQQAPGYGWQVLDRVRLQGHAVALTLHTPLGRGSSHAQQQALAQALAQWQAFLDSYQAQDWATAAHLLAQLGSSSANATLRALYAQRIAALRTQPFQPDWDGVTDIGTV